MPHDLHPISRWSAPFVRALWSTIPRSEQKELLSHLEVHSRDNLFEQTRTCETLQRELMQAWRRSNSKVVAAGDHVSIDGSSEQCEALLSQFDPRQILLELITDEHDDGWELARWVVDNVESQARRKEFASILDEWSASEDEDGREPSLRASGRVIIFGGHTRDPKMMTRRLFEGTDIEVRWKTCDKGQGDPRDDEIREWMAYADAAIVVTSMVSHNVMKARYSLTLHAGSSDPPVSNSHSCQLTRDIVSNDAAACFVYECCVAKNSKELQCSAIGTNSSQEIARITFDRMRNHTKIHTLDRIDFVILISITNLHIERANEFRNRYES